MEFLIHIALDIVAVMLLAKEEQDERKQQGS